MTEPLPVIVSGAFDDPRSRHLRFLEEAAKHGRVTVALWSDEMLQRGTRQGPKFPFAERFYLLSAVRYISRVIPFPPGSNPDDLPLGPVLTPGAWVDWETEANAARQDFCRKHGIRYQVISDGEIQGFPAPHPVPPSRGRKKVIVTGCYDWFHSGHVRFFEEVSAYGDLYVVVGHDANIRLLKGAGHPLVPEDERRYVVGSIRYVSEALISSGEGWLDAEPEIQRIKPDIYAVNEEGDRGGKREYCQKLGIEYLVLKRTPAPGLPGRSSTDLRGF